MKVLISSALTLLISVSAFAEVNTPTSNGPCSAKALNVIASLLKANGNKVSGNISVKKHDDFYPDRTGDKSYSNVMHQVYQVQAPVFVTDKEVDKWNYVVRVNESEDCNVFGIENHYSDEVE